MIDSLIKKIKDKFSKSENDEEEYDEEYEAVSEAATESLYLFDSASDAEAMTTPQVVGSGWGEFEGMTMKECLDYLEHLVQTNEDGVNTDLMFEGICALRTFIC